MSHDETIVRFIQKLTFLYAYFEREKKAPLARLLRMQKLPHDYCTILVEMGVLHRTSRGLRGPASYVWNHAQFPTPNWDMAELAIEKYNTLRRKQKEAYQNGTSHRWNIIFDDAPCYISERLKTYLKENFHIARKKPITQSLKQTA